MAVQCSVLFKFASLPPTACAADAHRQKAPCTKREKRAHKGVCYSLTYTKASAALQLSAGKKEKQDEVDEQ